MVSEQHIQDVIDLLQTMRKPATEPELASRLNYIPNMELVLAEGVKRRLLQREDRSGGRVYAAGWVDE